MIALTISSCLKEEEAPPRSMEQIHNEDGLPVTTEIVVEKGFDNSLTFFATLQAIKETNKGAYVGDRIEKINANIGDYVKQGDIIIEFPTNNPALQFDQAKSAYENSKKTYERLKKLLEAGEVSQQNFDNAATQYEVNKRNYESMKQMLYVEAPISGTIVSMPVTVGESVRSEALLFTVAQLHKMIATINVSDTEINNIKRGMKATATWNGESFEGRVTEIPLAMDPKTRSFPVKIEFDNPKKTLKSGILVDIKIDIATNDNALIVNRNLIKRQNGTEFVYVVRNGVAEKRIVETAETQGVETRVVSGLTAQDTLINCCSNLLEDGMKIRITKEGKH